MEQSTNEAVQALLKEQKEQKEQANNSKCTGSQFKDFITMRLSHFNSLQEVIKQERATRLSFDTYIKRGQLLNNICKMLSPKGDRSLVFTGSGLTISPAIKGHVRAPLHRLVKMLKSKPSIDVIKVDEFRTT